MLILGISENIVSKNNVSAENRSFTLGSVEISSDDREQDRINAIIPNRMMVGKEKGRNKLPEMGRMKYQR